MPRIAPLLALVAGLGLLAAACGEPPAADDVTARTGGDEDAPADLAASPTPDAPPEATPTTPAPPALALVATVAPIADLVARVAGDRVAVETLVPAGADSHTYEPRPGDVASFADADAFIGMGLGLNPGAVRLAQQHLPEGAPVVLLGESALDGQRLLDDDHGHTHDHTHDDHDHTHDGPNPHVWTSVRLAMELVDGIAAVLTDLDPGAEQTYADNARAYLLELRELDEAIAEAAASIPTGQRTLLAYHDAWGYFARDYGLEAMTAVQPVDFSEPSASEVRAIIDLIRERDVPALFGSEVFPSDVLETVTAETGASYVGDLADDVLPAEPGHPEHSYVGLMRRNATLIVEALGGSAEPLRSPRR